jgi:CelD/BcsL family acetyltransferase involved in cellulose biosynthesis
LNALPRLEIHITAASAMDAWAELEELAPASVYQTRRWLLPWMETVCPVIGMTPLLTIARDPSGVPLALLPLGISVSRGLRLVQFLGGTDSNANLGLFRPGFAPPRKDLIAILFQAAHASKLNPDAFVLANQPLSWEGVPNPFAAITRQDSPSFCYSTALRGDFESFIKERLSADTRKKLRAKQRKLSEIGPVVHRKAETEAEVEAFLDAYFEQRQRRFTQMNITANVRNKVALDYYRRSCLPNGAAPPAIELHALKAGERIVAIYGGGIHRGRFHGMINSFDMDPQVARSSPGDLLLAKLVEDKCREGLTRFDLGIGEGRYKNAWCNEAEPLFDTLIGLSGKGQAFIFMEKMRRRTKRMIKQSDWAWPMAKKIRASLRFGRNKEETKQ